jgi:hypothetical protein
MEKSAIQACLFDTATFQDNKHYTSSWVRFFAFHYRFPCRDASSADANILSVSIDATIAIAFGLAATITSLIAIYIMWQDRNTRRHGPHSEYLN